MAPALTVVSTVRSQQRRRVWWAVVLCAAMLTIVIVVLVGAFGAVVDAIAPGP
jgi:nitrate reductase NapE component